MRDASTLSGRTIAEAEADILSRAVLVGQVHNAAPLTGGLSLASAMRVPCTIAATRAPGALAPDDEAEYQNPTCRRSL
ncbi:hypothetical protein P279_24230 [Rhodobacteraceae bacterium PD-2]|nr:hypothetical protein P279_24230 [Rhodobacteraceae bacterium PD-2]